ncbi:MAG: hypothetical protein IKD45_02655 [Clostridia bacterium]|nr:hypothetical protein [Clostridia bacterium]
MDAWQNYTYAIVGGEEKEITVAPHSNPELLSRVNSEAGYPYSPEVVRLVLNSASLRFVDVVGDIVPPSPEDVPSRPYLAYGSSITNGSHSYAAQSTFVSKVAAHFRADALNRGLAGNARLEGCVADEIALMGERGEWDFATLCLGINIADIPPSEFEKKVRYMLERVASANPDKHVFAISPIYSKADMEGKGNLVAFREVVESEVARIGAERLHYINGLSLLGDASGLSGDFVHPTPDGADKIAANLIQIMSHYI